MKSLIIAILFCISFDDLRLLAGIPVSYLYFYFLELTF